MRALPAIIVLICVASVQSAQPKPSPTPIRWQPWSEAAFAQARRDGKPVLMDLHAVWCHWCHVMDQETYGDPAVASYVNEHFIAVSVDQDSRPDISARYENYGWPATIVFSGDHAAIVKRSGYIPPRPMLSLLQAIIADPTPGPSAPPEEPLKYASTPQMTLAQRATLKAVYDKAYDAQQGGWGDVHKYLDWDNLEFALAMAQEGNEAARHNLQQTLTACRRLIDPVWGGAYQYSTDGDWIHPHFEKIMQMQGEDMKVFALGGAALQDAGDVEAARAIARFLQRFMTGPGGAFYTSMDADLKQGRYAEDYFALGDEARRKLGLPRVDTHIYARENGWAITGLATLYSVTGETQLLDVAERAETWILANRALAGQAPGEMGFRHDQKDVGGPYLDDTLAMGRAYLALYEATAERRYLDRAARCAAFIGRHFAIAGAGFAAAASADFQSTPEFDQNVMLGRFANLLAHYTGRSADREIALRAMRFVITPEVVARQHFSVGGVLMLDDELRRSPIHIAIVGHKSDPGAKALFAAARALPIGYMRLEWSDPDDGPLMNADVVYPQQAWPLAYICVGDGCGMPVRTPEALRQRFAQGVLK